MLKNILISIVLLTSSVSYSADSNLIPCYDKMLGLLLEFVEAGSGTTNIIVELENQDENYEGMINFELRWNAPKDTYMGATFTTRVIATDGQCISEFMTDQDEN